ncbi:6-pyruvoyl tetrahydropterin synthase [Fontimonas thermophila]|uniref:6-carboxy-5,6,7,8-tetrahydropterin synthase n=1 Tax=Fontimonas thermophila TaxID=1076937 RepID=A0A1I2IC98_9GAMM|nr:6-carboxytetrahydropterin synthase [Fontimonas thermophila]SFF39915.1 6-pyruvoyl tetrahydropterin synthase [Fontimonas thermophila]
MTCLFVEQLTVIDCAYLDAARGLVGESWIVDVELEGHLDAESMLLDFAELKRRCKQVIDRSVDHRLLVPAAAPELQLTEDGEDLHLVFRSDIGVIEHLSPRVAVTLVDTAEIDAQTVSAHLHPRLRAVLPDNVGTLRVLLRHERIDGAYYHYVHGLKKHRGACQRIAHGHRSKIEVCVDGVRDPSLERAVAHRWLDIYLGTREDIVARGNGRIRFAYRAAEGHYQLALPETHVDLLDGDSTVERIAEHLARRLAYERPGQTVAVRAYEGIMKGASAQARIG